VFRVLSGFGIGGVMPISASIAAEYAPPQRRGVWVSAVYAGFVTGWALAAVVAIFMVPAFGWKGMFLVGLLPVVYSLVMLKYLPESLQILAKKQRFDLIRETLVQLGYTAFQRGQYTFLLDQVEEQHNLANVRLLFQGGLGATTVLLWVGTFFTLLFMFGYASWLPSLMVKSGHGLVRSFSFSLVVDIAQVIGNLLMGVFMDRYGPKRVTILYFLLLAVSVVLFGLGSSNAYIYVFSVLVGLFTAVQAGIKTILAHVYPTNVRATGIGWNAGIGRFGSIFGPVVVGWLVRYNLSLEGYMLAFAVMALLAMVTVVLSRVRISSNSSFPNQEQTAVS
ncbi:MAG: MFS transporter, partial [Alicyclobacillus sp.]|nr:MFS transporter [Alicyclobacillus sp.]